MTCLIPIGLSGAGMKLHTSMLGTFLYTPKYADFQEKNLCRDFWGKAPNIGHYIKMIFYLIPKVWNDFLEISAEVFS